MVAVATLFCATVNAQTLNFISVSPNKEQGINIHFQTVNPNPWVDSVQVVLEYALTPSFSSIFMLKTYSYVDSFKNIADSLDDNRYNFPAPGTTIFVRMRMYPDTSKWTPLQSFTNTVTLKVKPALPKITVIVKPTTTAKGVATTLSLESNVDFKIRKYVHFKDSAKVFSSGSIQTLSYVAGKYTVFDTIANLTQSSWLAYEIENEVGKKQTGVMKVSQYVIPDKPWNGFDSLIGYANSLRAVFRVVGNTLSGNTSVYYKHKNDATWSMYGPYSFTGNGIENFVSAIPVTKTGEWKVFLVSTNSKGSFTSDTLTVSNDKSPASSVTVSITNVTYNGPGKIKIDFRVGLTSGESIEVYAMAAPDTLFTTAWPSKNSVKVSANGDFSIYIDDITQTGTVWATLRYSKKSNNAWVDKVRPFVSVSMQYAMGTKDIETQKVSVFPNPTTSTSGFTVSVSKPETLTMFDASGKAVFTKTVHDGELVQPLLPTGLYYYKIGTTSGKIIFN